MPPVEMPLRATKFTIMGIQGSGKTVLARFIARRFRTLVYSPHAHDWTNERKVHLITPASINKKFEDGIEQVVKFFVDSKFDLLVLDESDLLFRTKFDIKREANNLIVNHRHIKGGKAVCFVTRRPQDIPPKILETCHTLFIFSLEGKNAIEHLEGIRKGLGKQAAQLPFGSFKFLLKKIGQDAVIAGPISMNESTK